MLNRLTDRRMRRVILSALAGTALLAGCDQVTERLDRAKDVAETSAGQISGETIVDPGARNLETASTADRALAGTVMAEFVVDEEERPLFAIGSIIAKPIDIPPPSALAMDDEALSAEELEYFEEEYYYEEPAVSSGEVLEALPPPASAPDSASSRAPSAVTVSPEQLLPKITLDPRAVAKSEREIAQAGADIDKMVAEEPLAQRRLKGLTREEFKALPVEEKAEMRKLARRAPVSRDAIKAQIDANSVMLDTMTKYGIGGEVALSRQGQMVIQIGADGASPTQFRGAGTGPADFLAREDATECPDDIQPSEVAGDLALATACVVRDLRASGQFEYVEKDFIFQNQFVRRTKDAPPPAGTGTKPGGSTGGTTTRPATPASFNPNDPLWTLQWHFRDRGTADGRTAGGAGFESFWNRQGTAGSRSVVVAVIDTGLQMSHPDIAGSPNIMAGWDMVSDPRMGNDGDGRDSDPNDPGDMCDPTKPYAADSFHGTHVAGTVGAASTNNGAGVAGGAWNVRVVPVRALGKCGGRLSDINDAIRWSAGLIPAEGPADTEVWNENPADIINLSIGLLGACPASLQDAIDAVTERGAIVVSAAGNARMSTTFYAPAGCRGVVTVAASDARGQITPYSNYGPEVTLLAPGGDLTRDDNGDGKPDGVLSTKAASNCYDPVTGEGVETCFYAYEQGTSMAAPHVSAALALLKARSPSATKEQLIATLTGALDPRQPLQCSGLCSQYPGTTALPGNPDMCARPCGTGLLNLANIPAASTGGGGR